MACPRARLVDRLGHANGTERACSRDTHRSSASRSGVFPKSSTHACMGACGTSVSAGQDAAVAAYREAFAVDDDPLLLREAQVRIARALRPVMDHAGRRGLPQPDLFGAVGLGSRWTPGIRVRALEPGDGLRRCYLAVACDLRLGFRVRTTPRAIHAPPNPTRPL